MNSIMHLVDQMRNFYARIEFNVGSGHLVRKYEVGPRSFVQVITAVPLTDKREPVTWEYSQLWVDKAKLDMQEELIGLFLNEWNGQSKIIGIYEEV